MKKIKTLSLNMNLEDYVFLQRLGKLDDNSPSEVINIIIDRLKHMSEESIIKLLEQSPNIDNNDIGTTDGHLYISGIGDKQIYEGDK
tara:strand:- start:3510 stop:3770 length:261 start_codon:yes stop_codon:yes gene_type:complete